MNRLITIPPSHYCEKARWALERAGIGYVEDGHAPMLHWLWSLPLARSRTVPVLIRDDGGPPLVDSTDILHFCDRALAPEQRLFPEGDDDTARLEARWDAGLGVSARRLAYCYVAESSRLFQRAFLGGLGPREAALVARADPALRWALRRAFRTSERAAARMRSAVEAELDEVARRLADGRPYLTGDRFTAADLTFVSLALPVLFYDIEEAELDATEPRFAEVVRALRATPAGRFAFRVWERHRRERVAS